MQNVKEPNSPVSIDENKNKNKISSKGIEIYNNLAEMFDETIPVGELSDSELKKKKKKKNYLSTISVSLFFYFLFIFYLLQLFAFHSPN